MMAFKKAASVVLVIGLIGALTGGSFLLDVSGDGMTVSEDIKHGTNPFSADTAGNGLTDYEEVYEYGTDPTEEDTLGNGLSDGQEVELGLDPTKEDTLGNGLTDYEEVEIHGTDPLKEDTLGNGLTDYEEVEIHGTDPTAEDTLGNGLADAKEVELGLDPTKEDTAGNGLADTKELEIGTDPTAYDTSGDGLPDGLLYELEDADPLEKNVLVQVSYQEEIDVPESELEEVIEAFDNAPVENEHGDDGINLVLWMDDEPKGEPTTVTVTGYALNFYEEEFSMQGYGFHHSYFVHEAAQGDDNSVIGFAVYQNDGTVVEKTDREEQMAANFMHEIGHQIGLWPEVYEGIDSHDLDWGEYPSLMNYNRPIDCTAGTCQVDYQYQYSDGEGFDDWGYIEENLADNAPDTSAYDENGELPEDDDEQKDE